MADHEPASFACLGHAFRARKAPAHDGTSMFAAFLPEIPRATRRINLDAHGEPVSGMHRARMEREVIFPRLDRS